MTNPEKAYHDHKLVADRDQDGGAQIELGHFLRSLGRNNEAFHYFQLASQNLNDDFSAKGLFYLAESFERGLGVEKSEEAAVSNYQQAADKGELEAQYRLGRAYAFGELGLTVSLELGAYYYTLAADRGYPSAQYALGVLLYLEKKYKKALPYFQLVIENSTKGNKELISKSRYYLERLSGEGKDKDYS